MARPPAYQLYRGDMATVHESNKLEDLVKLGKLLGGALGKRYTVRDLSGNVVWEEEK